MYFMETLSIFISDTIQERHASELNYFFGKKDKREHLYLIKTYFWKCWRTQKHWYMTTFIRKENNK